MPFEIFTREVIRNTGPAVSITTMGRMALNKAATAVLNKNAVEHVFLLFDKDTQRCAIRPTTKKDPRAYRLSFAPKGNGTGFSCVTFLNFIHYDWSKTRAFPMEWSTQDDMFVFKIPQDNLIGKPAAQQLPLGQLRRSDRKAVPKAKETSASRTMTQ